MADVVPLPAPYGGINELVPVIALQSPECEVLENYNPVQEGIELRAGDSQYQLYNLGGGDDVRGLFKYGDTSLWFAVKDFSGNNLEIYNAATGVSAYSSVATGSVGIVSTYFNKNLYLWCTGSYSPGYVYDGSTWGVIGYTGAGTFSPYGGNTFNSRHYMAQLGEAAYWYSDINAITGATTKVDVSSLVSTATTLSSIVSFTLSENLSAVEIQCFLFGSGEILFFSGSYPDSTDWQQVGRAKIAQPLGYSSAFQFQGDALVMCDTGLVSMRDLFLKGSQAAQSLSVNTKIQRTWMDLVRRIRAKYSIPSGPITPTLFSSTYATISGIWDEKGDRIIVVFPFVYDEFSGQGIGFGNTFFIFDASLSSWFIHNVKSSSEGGPGFTLASASMLGYQRKVLLLSCESNAGQIKISEKEGSTTYLDWGGTTLGQPVTYAYAYEVISAPIPLGRQNTQKVAGVEVIINTSANISVYVVRDLGVETTSAQTVTSLPASTLQKVFANVGIEGAYIQWRVAGTSTATSGHQIYGVNVWSEQGSRPR